MFKNIFDIFTSKDYPKYDYESYEKSPIFENISDAIDDKIDDIAEKLGIERKPKWERDMEKWEKDYNKKTLMEYVNELNVGDIFEYLGTYYEVISKKETDNYNKIFNSTTGKYCINPLSEINYVKSYNCLGTLEEKKEKLIERNIKISQLSYNDDNSFNTEIYKLKIKFNNVKDTMRNVNRNIKSNKYEKVSEYNLNLGDHILVQYLGYTHHAIYIGDGVIEQSKKGNGVRHNKSFENFANGRQVYRVCEFESPKLYSNKEIVERAKSRLNESVYNLFVNNCESFAQWCRNGCYLFVLEAFLENIKESNYISSEEYKQITSSLF
ncbi:MAG: lecithin retinol acyltransferase family protein [Sarcina sp.]